MKRVVSLFFCFTLIIVGMILRLWSLMIKDGMQTTMHANSITVEAGSSRGYIYDRNMKPFVNSANRLVAVVSPVTKAVNTLKKITEKKRR